VIVDDDARFLDVARTSLERGDVIVAGVAGNRVAAVQRVAELRPDVVLVDIRLGAESGFDVARDLAASGNATRLIMISSHAEADYADLIAEAPSPGSCPRPSCPPWPSAAARAGLSQQPGFSPPLLPPAGRPSGRLPGRHRCPGKGSSDRQEVFLG
jgi:DNA-binding NarL/FixJ family response regulator